MYDNTAIKLKGYYGKYHHLFYYISSLKLNAID